MNYVDLTTYLVITRKYVLMRKLCFNNSILLLRENMSF